MPHRRSNKNTPLPHEQLDALQNIMNIKIEYGPTTLKVTYGDGRIALYETSQEMNEAIEARIAEWALSMGLTPLVVSTHIDSQATEEGVCREEITYYTITVGMKASVVAESIYILKLYMKSETSGCMSQRTLTPVQTLIEQRPLPDKELTPKAYRAMERINWEALGDEDREKAGEIIRGLAVHELAGEDREYVRSITRMAGESRPHRIVLQALRHHYTP